MNEQRLHFTVMTFGLLTDRTYKSQPILSADFFRRLGGNVVSCPVAGAELDGALAKEYAYRLITGAIDVSVFMTGAGTEKLIRKTFEAVSRPRVIDSLTDTLTVAASPNVRRVLESFDIRASIAVSSNSRRSTWRDVVASIDQHFHRRNLNENPSSYALGMANFKIGIEASRQVHSLTAAFEARFRS